MADHLIEVGTGTRLHYRRIGAGEPLLLLMGTAASLGMWMPVEERLADRFDVVSFDYRGLGESERGDGPITAASLAEDAHALLDALSIPRAHVIGWSLGSIAAHELALRPLRTGREPRSVRDLVPPGRRHDRTDDCVEVPVGDR